jgi:hypothetical protein
MGRHRIRTIASVAIDYWWIVLIRWWQQMSSSCGKWDSRGMWRIFWWRRGGSKTNMTLTSNIDALLFAKRSSIWQSIIVMTFPSPFLLVFLHFSLVSALVFSEVDDCLATARIERSWEWSQWRCADPRLLSRTPRIVVDFDHGWRRGRIQRLQRATSAGLGGPLIDLVAHQSLYPAARSRNSFEQQC